MQLTDIYKIFEAYPSISTDTRQITKDSLFFALKGESFNGNSFAEQALAIGAKYVIIDDKAYFQDKPGYILVDDVLKTLQDLALHHRRQLNIPFIGITGTNGKTTSKELLNSVLSQQFNCYATKGNLNNHIGVPLTILSLTKEVEVAIIEMGANHVGEIAFLAAIAEPTHGFITNVGKAHLEGFGSFEGVKKTKGELYDFLKATNGQIFVQGDNEELCQMANQRNLQDVIYYGFSNKNQVQGGLVKANPYLSIFWKKASEEIKHEVSTQLTGAYNTENILASVALGLYFGLSASQINEGISSYVPQNNRSQIKQTGKNLVIADYYNANASSMAAAINNIEVIEADKKAVILGDMFEMGDESFIEHQKLIQKAKAIAVDKLIFVGKAFYAQKDAEADFYETTEELKQELAARPLEGYTILLKASRGMAFEKLMEVL